MVELQWLVPEDRVEAVSDALIDELGALSVSVEDADADTAAEQALFGEPGMPAPRGGWQRSRLVALFENEAAATDAATLLMAQDWTAGVQLLGLAPVEDQDWVRLTQSQFEPVEIGTGFWIVPSWHEPPPAARSRDPAGSGPGVRHRHPSDHSHVPALDRPPGGCTSRRLDPRARLWLRIGHPRDRCGAARRPLDRRARHRSRRRRIDAGQCARQRRGVERRPARRGARSCTR